MLAHVLRLLAPVRLELDQQATEQGEHVVALGADCLVVDAEPELGLVRLDACLHVREGTLTALLDAGDDHGHEVGGDQIARDREVLGLVGRVVHLAAAVEQTEEGLAYLAEACGAYDLAAGAIEVIDEVAGLPLAHADTRDELVDDRRRRARAIPPPPHVYANAMVRVVVDGLEPIDLVLGIDD